MKIAVISDIHGNIDALEAVIKDIKNIGCEKVFVLGDYAMAGAYGVKMPRIGSERGNLAYIPIPPKAEQNRIVLKIKAILEKLEKDEI